MSTYDVTDQNFNTEVLQSKGLTLVDFWAEWCGPCRMLIPTLQELAAARADIKVVKVNVDSSPATPSQFGVQSIPTLILFKDGQKVASQTGVRSRSALEEWIDSFA